MWNFWNLCVFIIFLSIIIIRFYQVLPRRHSRHSRHSRSYNKLNNKKPPFKTCIVLGSGGHTMEMLQLLKGVDFNSLYRPRKYIVTGSDILSSEKARNFESHKGNVENVDYIIQLVPRSREVGQSWITTPFSVLKSLIACIRIILFDLPDLVICNGPGSCIPVCVISYIPRFFGIKWIKLIYVESFARVKTLSLSGKLLISFVDRFIVQWPYLTQKYPQAEYKGILV
ncbi:hypothetical protein Glove_348g25 [Diversispora epigaea]|uniref:UDP-N-acetylglucosamine transferase subunit ALG14 n=1 Tax=Diversispora epigaea TaxID=1348612 RepID=A0A397HDZ9_9GLOM|nr:hypothetical protein Glove_348g25 [Diversispora epigaea]